MKFRYIKYFFFFFFLLFIPVISFAKVIDSYEDKVYQIVDEKTEDEKINIYFFFGDGCPHCANEEKFLAFLEDKYGDYYNLYTYETWYNSDNLSLMKKVKEIMGDNVNNAVPYTIIGDTSYLGYNDSVGEKIEGKVKEYHGLLSEDESVVYRFKEKIPILGEIDKRDVSIGLVAVVLGFIDGFNPCAMWVLLFLINMLIGMNDKKKMLIIGCVFLLTSAFMYFLFMLGITNILSFIETRYIRLFIGIIAFCVGIYNVFRFFKERNKDDGCHVVDEKKRKKIFTKIKKFTTEKNLFIALFGVVILAISVNLVELACSSVFPAVFAEILAVNDVNGLSRIFYLLIYTFFYMIDDLVVFVISVATLQLSTASSKYGKYSSVVGGIIMLLVGLLLTFKPEWLMLNFS